MNKFKVGDNVICVDRGAHGAGWKLGKSFIIGSITCSDDNVYWPEDGTSGVYESSLVLLSSIKNNMNILEKFAMMMKGEPEKSFFKAGITDSSYKITADGTQVFLQWLLKKYGDEFKIEVVDGLLEEDNK